jgi:hypothetical protein
MTHQAISFVKSAIRIVAYAAIGYIPWITIHNLVTWVIPAIGITLVLSEAVGVLEEVGQ